MFIVGTGRCGTTLLRLILNRNSSLAILDETNLFFKPGRYGPLADARSLVRFCKDWTITLCERSPYPAMMRSNELRSRLAVAASYAEAVEIAASHYAVLEKKSRWGEKTPRGVQHLREIVRAFPKAKVIYMVRDPRAFVLSAIRQERNPSFDLQNAYNKAKYWVRCEQLADKFQKLSPQNIKQVKYEDLVANPDTVLRDICSFLGVDFKKNMLATASSAQIYAPKGPDGNVATAHKGLLENINILHLAAWKEDLSPQIISLIEVATHKWLGRRGYAESLSGQPRVSTIRKIVLEIGWQIDKLQLAIPRFFLRGFWIARVLTEYMTSMIWRLRSVAAQRLGEMDTNADRAY